MIDKQLALDILTEATKTGADFCEIYIENNNKSNISLVNGVIEKAQGGVDFGVGIRVFYNNKTIYSYTNSLAREDIINCARNIAKAVKVSSFNPINIKDFEITDYAKNSNHNHTINPEDINKSEIVKMLKNANDVAFNYDSQIKQTKLFYLHSVQDICIINTEGVFATDKRVRTRSSVNVVASNDIEKQTAHFGPGALMGFEFYDKIDLCEIAKEASRSAVCMLNAKPCPSGKLPVVIDNGFGGVIFHEACGHSLEATSVAKGTSVFTNKLGQKIASTKLTAYDDGTIKNSWGSLNIDDEGQKTQKTLLVENGILKNFLVDKFNGKKLGLKATGSSRRESYKYIPTSRMTNTYIAPGNDKKEDIIKNTEYGIYAKYMGGGSVNTSTGDFNFAVNEAYLIKNGEIKEPLRGATLIGKGEEVLKNIDMVSDNLKLAEGMCGASSGSIPVNVGQPMIRVSSITVGGKS